MLLSLVSSESTAVLHRIPAHQAINMKLDPDADNLPKRSEIKAAPGQPEDAAWVWGENDEVNVLFISTETMDTNQPAKLGRLNLLTPRRKLAAAKLIETAETINLE